MPRIAVYTHDTFGLGHVRRCMTIIRALAVKMPEAAILLVTGSPALGFFKDMPPNVDVMKIPTIVKTGRKGSQPPHLPIGVPEITLLRSNILKEAVTTFQPDVFLVDNFPLGSQAELLPLLHELKGYSTKTMVGLRDIVNDPKIIKGEWRKLGVYEVLKKYYDKVLIYGMEEVFDAVKEYELPSDIAKKLHYCGYLTATDEIKTSAQAIREELGIDGPFILATGGGGGDAYPLLSTFLKAHEKVSHCSAVVFMGPLMGENDRELLRNEVGGNVILRDSVSDLRPYLKAADVVISMCGYNMASEIVFHKKRAIVSPRTWRFGEHSRRDKVREDREQIMRARALANKGLLHLLEPETLTPSTLADKISEVMDSPHLEETPIQVHGVDKAVAHIQEMVTG